MVIVEELLLGDGQYLPFDGFRDQVRGREQLADVDGYHNDHDLAHENRRASLEPVGDGYQLRGEGGVAQGAVMREILDAFCDGEFAADCDEARRRLGLGPDDRLSPTAYRSIREPPSPRRSSAGSVVSCSGRSRARSTSGPPPGCSAVRPVSPCYCRTGRDVSGPDAGAVTPRSTTPI
jgi:hypothetical protein